MNRILRQAINHEAKDFDPDTGQVDMICFTGRSVMETLKEGLDDAAVAKTLARACGMNPKVAGRDGTAVPMVKVSTGATGRSRVSALNHLG